MAILESVRKLAEKLGAETNGRDITDQINKINEHLDSTASRDIAEAVSKFADKEDGTAILTTKSITENGTYKASDDDADGYSQVEVDVSGLSYNKIRLFVPSGSFRCNVINNSQSTIVETQYEYSNCTFANPLKKFTRGLSPVINIVFTPSDDYDGFYQPNGTKINFSGDTVTAGDGYAYEAKINNETDAYEMVKLYNAKGKLITVE